MAAPDPSVLPEPESGLTRRGVYIMAILMFLSLLIGGAIGVARKKMRNVNRKDLSPADSR